MSDGIFHHELVKSELHVTGELSRFLLNCVGPWRSRGSGYANVPLEKILATPLYLHDWSNGDIRRASTDGIPSLNT
jgi:hypothetical protein